MELTKENWESLTDDEKTQELQKIIPGVDYAQYRKVYEKLKEVDRDWFGVFEHPVLVLELIDPIMGHAVMNWLYTKGDKIDGIPLFGYKLTEICLDKSSLSGFSDEERVVVRRAMEILKSKVG